MEVKLWSRLKKLRSEGYRFRRQAPFRGYYLDFVCFTRRLVIEVDGGQHGEDEARTHDEVRDAVLRREGFRVLRFWTSAVRENIDGVMLTIQSALAERQVYRPAGDPPVRPSAGHPPHAGRETT
jgi:very-short-patch-repair endonuclease